MVRLKSWPLTARWLNVLRQSVALLTKVALKQSFPEIEFGEETGDENGFYIDTDKADGQVSADSLPAIADKVQA